MANRKQSRCIKLLHKSVIPACSWESTGKDEKVKSKSRNKKYPENYLTAKN